MVRRGANDDDAVFVVGADDGRTTYEIRLLRYHRFRTREWHRIGAIVFHGVEGGSAVFVVHADDGLTYEIRVWEASMWTVGKGGFQGTEKGR